MWILQALEKEYLGFYVTSHPLSSIVDKLPFLTTHNIAELSELPDEKMVTICGLLSQVRQIPTKKDPTKFLKAGVIEDLTGKMEFVAFHKTLVEYNTFLESEKKVIISGKLQKRDENQLSIIVDTVKPVENSNIVTLSLNGELPFEEIVALKDMVTKYKGTDPLVIKMKTEQNEDLKILCGSNFWVDSTNEFTYAVKNNYAGKIAVAINSLDA